jgi:uncharacterized protein YqhQ
MTGLEQTFYIMGIIFMCLSFLLMVAIVAAIFVIKAKINKIHDTVENKISLLTSVAGRGGELTALASKQALKQVKRVVNKAKK